MALEFIKLVKGDSPVSQVGSYGFFKLGVESSSGGGFSRVFGENDWQTISNVSSEIASNNMTAEQVATTYGWNLGDVKSETLSTGEVIELQIIGFNHDNKSDGNGKAGMTLQMVNCLTTKYPMNNTQTDIGGWDKSVLRTVTLPTIKATLSQDLQNVIKQVNKMASRGSNSPSAQISVDDLFLLSEKEALNTVTWARDGANEGTQYEYFVKGGTPSRGAQCWSRSNRSSGQIYFVSYFTSSSRVVANTPTGVSFAFCV